MKLQLKKPLCFFDLETTGTDISKDRIIEIAILKLFPDGTKETLETRINPEIPIPIEASMVHGITDQMVINQPSFKEVSKKIYDFIKGCDLAGFNSDFFIQSPTRAEPSKAFAFSHGIPLFLSFFCSSLAVKSIPKPIS